MKIKVLAICLIISTIALAAISTVNFAAATTTPTAQTSTTQTTPSVSATGNGGLIPQENEKPSAFTLKGGQ